MSTYFHILAFIICSLGVIADIIFAILAFLGIIGCINDDEPVGCLIFLLVAIFVVMTLPAFILGVNWAFGG